MKLVSVYEVAGFSVEFRFRKGRQADANAARVPRLQVSMYIRCCDNIAGICGISVEVPQTWRRLLS